MRKHVMILFCFCMMLFMFGSAGMVLSIQAESSDGKLPESLYLQPPVGICSSCGEPIFEREGSWAEDTRCYTCWAIDRNKHSIVTWTPPKPYCIHCGDSTLGNISGYCDDCIMAACGSHTQTVTVKEKETGKPIEGAEVSGGALQRALTDSSGKASVSDSHMHLDGSTTLKVTKEGYQSREFQFSILDLSKSVTVEMEKLPETFSIPIQAVQFAGEAFGPVALNTELEADFLPFPISVENLISNEVTVKRDPNTGNYIGSIQLDGLANMLFDGDVSLRGDITAQWDERNSRLELINSNVDASVTLSADLGRVFFGVSGELTPQIRLSGYYDEAGQLSLVPQVSCYGSAYAYLGPKLEHTVKFGKFRTKLEAELTGGVQFNLRAELADHINILQDFVQINGNLRAKVKVLGFERSWEGFHWQYYPAIEEDTAYGLPEPTDRFPGRAETGTGKEDSQKFHPEEIPSVPAAAGAPVVDGADSDADPIILPTGSGSMTVSGGYSGSAVMFWLADAPERQELDRYLLVYSIFDGQKWSDPVPVHDDGTADYAPRAIYVGDTVYILWQNADKKFSGFTSSAEYAASIDLYAAVMQNGRIQGITNLTEAIGGYCGMHSLSLENGTVTARWAANASGDLLFAQGNNRGYETLYDDGRWITSDAEIQPVAAGEKPSIHFLALSASKFSQEDGIEAAGVQFYTREDGSVACIENGQEKILAGDARTTSFEVATNGEIVFVYWLHVGQNGAIRLDGVFYNTRTGKCSEARTYLDHGTALHGIHAAMDAEGTVLIAYLSSEWENIQQGTYVSSDLLTAALALPEDLEANDSHLWIWLTVGGLIVLIVIGISVILLIKKRKI